jgi:hypothetical protein
MQLASPAENETGLEARATPSGELEDDKPTKFRVLGLVDRTHPAAAYLLDDAVMRNGPADELAGCGHWREC